jgi:hypothetical protein
MFLERTLPKSFSPCPFKNKHKIYGINNFEKLKILICMVE